MSTKITGVRIERRYSDDSGVEFGCSLDGDSIVLTHINQVEFPIGELDWLLDSLREIRAILRWIPKKDTDQGPSPKTLSQNRSCC